jgi:hypothetical protein
MEEKNQLDNFFNISFDTLARSYVKSIALWAKICSVCAFVGYVIVLAVTIFGRKDYSAADLEGSGIGSYMRVGQSIVWVLLSIIIGAIINYFLYKFSVAASQAVDTMDPVKMNQGLDHLRTYFKIYGILLVIVLGLIALAVIVIVIASALSRG